MIKITNWSVHYENSRSRCVTFARWVPIPNSHEGEGYIKIMREPRASEIFTVWILLLQVASKCTPRGVLIRGNGQPMTAESLALRTRTPAEWWPNALAFLLKLGWLKEIENLEAAADAYQPGPVGVTGRRHPTVTRVTGAHHPSNGTVTGNHHPSNGTVTDEGKGRERNIDALASIAADVVSASPPTPPPPPPFPQMLVGKEGCRGENQEQPAKPARKSVNADVSAEWLAELSTVNAYSGIDVVREASKCAAWCATRGYQPSRRRLVNWLNRAEPARVNPTNGASHQPARQHSSI